MERNRSACTPPQTFKTFAVFRNCLRMFKIHFEPTRRSNKNTRFRVKNGPFQRIFAPTITGENVKLHSLSLQTTLVKFANNLSQVGKDAKLKSLLTHFNIIFAPLYVHPRNSIKKLYSRSNLSFVKSHTTRRKQHIYIILQKYLHHFACYIKDFC